MIHRLGTSDTARRECLETDRKELRRLTLELERMLVGRGRKISESGRHERSARSWRFRKRA